MKFLKNKIVQTLSAITLIVIIGVVVYISSDTKVKADDTVTMQYVNDSIKELQTQIDTLNTTIGEQKTQIENLILENTDLKAKVDKINYEEINKEITTINSKISKINAREDYLYDKSSGNSGHVPVNLILISNYINDNLK